MKYKITKIFHKSPKVAMFECECIDNKFYKWIACKTFSWQDIPRVEVDNVFEPDWVPVKEKFTNKYGLEQSTTKMVIVKFKWVENETPTFDTTQVLTPEKEQEVKQRLLDTINKHSDSYVDDDEKLINWD